jgi:hypothetical protein
MPTKADALLGGWGAKGRRMLQDLEFGRYSGQINQVLCKKSVIIRLSLCGKNDNTCYLINDFYGFHKAPFPEVRHDDSL